MTLKVKGKPYAPWGWAKSSGDDLAPPANTEVMVKALKALYRNGILNIDDLEFIFGTELEETGTKD